MEMDTKNTVKKALNDGHLICNHSWSHAYPISDWDAIADDEDKLTQELKKTNHVIQNITGTPARIYRAPYGDVGVAGARVAKALNILLVRWNVDPNDWDPAVEQESIKDTIISAEDGSDILMHCTFKDNANPLKTVKAVKKAIAELGSSCTYITVLELEYPVVPIYEYYAKDGDGYRYNYNTANQEVGEGWTKSKTPAFYACVSAIEDTKPFYRYHRVNNKLWYLDYYDSNDSRRDWNLDGVWWHGYSRQMTGLLPVYAERSGVNNNIRLVTNSNSKGELVFFG